MRSMIRAAAALSLLALVAGSAHADVAFDDFGPGNAFDTGDGWTVSGAGGVIGQVTDAMQFTSAASGGLTEIEVAVGITSGANSFTVSLLTDSGGVPGSVLESFALANVPIFSSPSAFEFLTSVSHPTLTVGTNYWLEVAASDPNSDTDGAWAFNSTGATGLFLQTPNAPSKNILSAFAVNVSAVPEPSSLALGLVGAVGAIGWAARRRRRPAVA